MASSEDHTVADFRCRAQRALSPQPPPVADEIVGHRGPSDFEHGSGHDWFEPGKAGMAPKPAAVLVPICDCGGRASVLLTRRARTMRAHAGQIAFPGGRADAADDGPATTALREAQEEIGLMADDVSILGFLDSYLTGTGYIVSPVVGVVGSGFVARPEPGEVAEIFDVPLDFLMNPANHQTHRRDIGGRSRTFVAMSFGDRYIWGATAGMLKNLYERVYC